MFTVHTSRITTRRTTAAFSDLLLLIPLVGLYAWAGSTRRRGEEDSWLFNQNHLTTVVEEGWKKGGVTIAFCSAEPAVRLYGGVPFYSLFIYLSIFILAHRDHSLDSNVIEFFTRIFIQYSEQQRAPTAPCATAVIFPCASFGQKSCRRHSSGKCRVGV